MTFRISGLDPRQFQPLWGASEAELRVAGAIRIRADAHPGYPDRITLKDAPIGSDVLLLGHISQPADTPFRASHAIFVLEGADAAFDALDDLPPAMLRRPQSLRAFDADGMMLAADIADGADIAPSIAHFFEDARVAEIHAHNARQGCFMARITRS